MPLVRMMHANLDPLRLRSKGWKKLPMWWLVERRLTNRSARVVVTCEAEREWCERAGVTAPTVIMSLASAGTLIFFHEPIPSLPALLTITMPFDASIDAALEQTDVMPSSSAYRCDIVLWSNSL